MQLCQSYAALAQLQFKIYCNPLDSLHPAAACFASVCVCPLPPRPELQVNGMQLADKIVYVGPFLKRTDRSASDSKFTNVYVKNLSEDVDDDALKKLAEEYGEVVSAVIMRVSQEQPNTDTAWELLVTCCMVQEYTSFGAGLHPRAGKQCQQQ